MFVKFVTGTDSVFRLCVCLSACVCVNPCADDPEQQVTQCFHPEHSELSSKTHLCPEDTH